jgi:hypothetical protein
MKKTLLFPLFVFCFIASFAQSPWYHFAEEFYFVKEIAVTNYRGNQFRYEIAVRSSPADTLSKIRIHGIAAGKGKEDFIKSNFILETRVEQEWTIYTIAGQIQEEAYRLLFYASVNGNGDFYFDDVTFYVEDAPGKWKQLELFNPSFEISKPDIFAGYYVSKRRSEGLKVHLSEKVYKTGHLSLNVKTYGNIPVSGIVQQIVNQVPQTEDELNFHQEFVDIAPDLMVHRTKKESSDKSPLLSKSKTK